MKRSRTILSSLLIICLFLFGGVIAIAQEATPEPDAPPVVTPLPDTDGNVVLSVFQVVIGVVAAVAVGGIVGIAGVGVLASRLRNDAATIAAIEALAKSVPPETAKQVVDLTGQLNKSMNEITLLVSEALDNVPASSKPPTYTAP